MPIEVDAADCRHGVPTFKGTPCVPLYGSSGFSAGATGGVAAGTGAAAFPALPPAVVHPAAAAAAPPRMNPLLLNSFTAESSGTLGVSVLLDAFREIELIHFDLVDRERLGGLPAAARVVRELHDRRARVDGLFSKLHDR